MTSQDAISIGTDALILAAKIAGPFLIAVLAIGVLIGLIQSVTQLQEQTLSFVPKLIAAALVIAISGSWMLDELVAFGHNLMARAPQLISG
ncbi:MAG: flagellar biosynthetic protein FliQ [Ilumatobacteraceae bacterium]|nr:flagellar biosynthetic protein FliQ [Ilumatobacteraceae bacterium]